MAHTGVYVEGWADVGLLGVMIYIDLLHPLPPSVAKQLFKYMS